MAHRLSKPVEAIVIQHNPVLDGTSANPVADLEAEAAAWSALWAGARKIYGGGVQWIIMVDSELRLREIKYFRKRP